MRAGDGGLNEVLSGALSADADLAWSTLVVRMGAALVAGAVVAGTHRVTRGGGLGWGAAPVQGRRRSGTEATGLVATLVLLTVLVAMMTLVIGNNVARAFGVVGALAIVRFRTNVEDTRDTAFVIFAVAVGTAIGAGYVRVPLVGVPVAMIAALLFQSGAGRGSDGTAATSPPGVHCELCVRVGLGQGAQEGVERGLAEAGAGATLSGVETARQGAALELTYRVTVADRAAMANIAATLNGVPGVQNVRLAEERA